MKKVIIPLGLVLVVIAGAILYISSTREKPCSECEKNAGNKKTQDIIFADYFKDETDFCNILTKETVSNLLGKTIIKTESETRSTLKSCQYYLDETHALVINYDLTAVDPKLKGHESLGRKITTNPKIIAKHTVVLQENGLINEIYLILKENEFVSINRPNGKLISEEEIINFAAKLGEIVSGIVPLSISKKNNQTPQDTVPLPQGEDIVRNFIALIEEKRPSDAVSAMNVTDNTEKQAWAVQFNAISSMKLLKIEPSNSSEWTQIKQTYKVTLDVKMNPNSADAPIPYYGWENGQNIRWITLEKVGKMWKIRSIATGP